VNADRNLRYIHTNPVSVRFCPRCRKRVFHLIRYGVISRQRVHTGVDGNDLFTLNDHFCPKTFDAVVVRSARDCKHYFGAHITPCPKILRYTRCGVVDMRGRCVNVSGNKYVIFVFDKFIFTSHCRHRSITYDAVVARRRNGGSSVSFACPTRTIRHPNASNVNISRPENDFADKKTARFDTERNSR